MTPLVSVLLSAVVLCLTVLLMTIGIQVYQILHEVKFSLKKLNRLLDQTDTLSDLVPGNRAHSSSHHSVASETDHEEASVDSAVDLSTQSLRLSHQSLPKRFFHRSGQALHPS